MKILPSPLLTSLSLLSLVGSAAAQEIPAVLVAGDTVTGASGFLVSFDSIDVNNSGDWIIEARTDTPEQVLISSSGLIAVEGDPLPGLPMETITTWDGPRLNNNGDYSANILTSGVDSALYWNDVLQLSGADFGPTPPFTAMSPYVDFREAWVNDANQLMVVASVDDPNLQQFTDSFIMVRDLDANGAVISENVVAKVDDQLPGMTGQSPMQFVEFIAANGNHQSQINNNGDVIYIVGIRGVLFPNTDNAIYINDDTLVAREGDFDPVTGRAWKTLGGSSAVGINDNGDFAFRGRLNAGGSGDWAVIKNNTQVFGQEGGTLPSIAPNTFREFTTAFSGTGPVHIDNAGNVLWYGEWEDAGGSLVGEALFLNDQILVQSGVATFGGTPIDVTGEEYAMSDTGQFILFSGRVGGTQAVFLLDLSDFNDVCFGDGGDQMGCTDCPCGNNSAPGTIGGCLNSGGTSTRLNARGLPSVTMDSLEFRVSGAPANSFNILNSGDNVAPNNMANPCFGTQAGILSVSFDGLRCAVGTTQRHGGRSADSNGDVGETSNGWGGPFPPAIGLVAQGGFTAGQTRYYQVIHREDAMAVCMRGLNTSQAVEVTFFP